MQASANFGATGRVGGFWRLQRVRKRCRDSLSYRRRGQGPFLKRVNHQIDMGRTENENILRAAIVVLLAVGTIAAFSPIVGNQFINYDDPGYITGNSHVAGGISATTIEWSFLSTAEGNWHPLTWI